MTDAKPAIKQQVLFEELPEQQSENLPAVLTEQVIIDETNFVDDEESEQRVELEEKQKSKPRWILRAVFAILSVLFVVETTEFFIEGFAQEPFIVTLYGVLFTLITLGAGKTIIKELFGLRRLKKRSSLQQQVTLLQKGEHNQSAQTLCQNILEELPCDINDEYNQKWHQHDHMQLSEQEVISLFSREVLSEVDRKALDKVSKFSTESVVLVALSPIAIIDMILMFVRNLKMIDEIAHLYGLKLGYWSRIRLIKQVFVNMVYAGATELVADLGAELIGADLLGKLSARLAQGLGAGMLTARLGLKTMQMCRPIAYEDQAPNLKDVRKKIITKIKEIANNKK